jgi:hypothetical protein
MSAKQPTADECLCRDHCRRMCSDKFNSDDREKIFLARICFATNSTQQPAASARQIISRTKGQPATVSARQTASRSKKKTASYCLARQTVSRSK